MITSLLTLLSMLGKELRKSKEGIFGFPPFLLGKINKMLTRIFYII